MARALVLPLLLAGVAALPTHLTSKADGAIPGHLRGRADASDHATFHSRYLRRIDEEVADAHDQHALTPPDGNGVHHVHRSTRGQSRPVGTPDAAHDRARRASARATHGHVLRHLSAAGAAATSRSRTRMSNHIENAQRSRISACARAHAVLARARLVAPAAGRIAPSLPCC